jgi:hypothetical protein
MANSLAVGINKLSLGPGDVVVISVPAAEYTPENVANVLAAFRAGGLWDGGCVVMPTRYGLAVIRDGEFVAPVADPPISVVVEAR